MIVIVGVAIGAALVSIIMWMLLTRRLREKYAIMWLVLGVLLLVLTLFPGLLKQATLALGVQLPANLLFAAAIVVLLGVALHLSWELSQNEGETRRLAEEVAILGARVDRLEQEKRDSGEDVGQQPPAPTAHS